MDKHWNEKGSVIVFVTIAMVVILGFASLVVDKGGAYLTKSNLQNTADAAALAGAQNMSVGTAIDIAGKNGLKAVENEVEKDGDTIKVTTSYKGDPTKIEVVCTRNFKYSLASVLGFTQSDVSARAVAQKKASFDPAFDYAIFSGNNKYTLKMSGNSDVRGSVHSNYKATLSGNSEIKGSVEAVSTFDMSGNTEITGTCQAEKITQSGNSSIGNPIQSPAPWVPMSADFADAIRNQVGPIHNGNITISGNTTVTEPIYIKGKLDISGNTTIAVTAPIYVEGDIEISGNYSYGGSCIFATGNIKISGNNDLSDSKVLIHSQNGNIDMSGNSSPTHGIVFAPKGTITISGNTIKGRVIGDKVALSGNYDVTSGADDLDILPGEDAVKLVE